MLKMCDKCDKCIHEEVCIKYNNNLKVMYPKEIKSNNNCEYFSDSKLWIRIEDLSDILNDKNFNI